MPSIPRPQRLFGLLLPLVMVLSLGGSRASAHSRLAPVPVPIAVDGPVVLPVSEGNAQVAARIGVALDDPYAQFKKPDGSPVYSGQLPEILDMGFDRYPPLVAARGAGIQWLRVSADVVTFAQCENSALRWNDTPRAFYRDLYRRAFAASVRLQIVINQARKAQPCVPLLGDNGSIAPYLSFARMLAQQNRTLREAYNNDPATTVQVEPLVYQIFNEPNNGDEPILSARPELFARLVYEATLAIREADPSAQVVSGGFGGGETAERGAPVDIKKYVQRFIDAYRALLPIGPLTLRQTPGLADAIGYNPYGDQDNIQWLRLRLDAAGFNALPIDGLEWGIHNDDDNSDTIANSLEASEDLRLMSNFVMSALERPMRNITLWTLRRSYIEPNTRRTAGLVAPVGNKTGVPGKTDTNCAEAGSFSNIVGVQGYFCRPKMYALGALLRVATDRTLLGSLLSSRSDTGQQQPGQAGVHAIKFEGGGAAGRDDVVAVWCPETDRDGCAFTFNKQPIAALDRVGRALSPAASVFTTNELDGVHFYFFPHPAPPPPPPGPVCRKGLHCAFLPIVKH